MFPVLFKLGPFTLYTYGLAAAVGFALAVWMSVRGARYYGLNVRFIQDLTFWVIVAALIGSRALFVVLAWGHYRDHFWDIFKIWEGGLVFYGGLIFALVTAVLYIRWRGQPVQETGDVMAPGLALGQAVGRLGCFAAGCCYGAPSDLPWAVTFTNPRCLAPLGISLHPAQLYASAGLLVIFAITLWLQRRRRFAGQVFWTYALLHGLFRPLLEAFRSDFRGDAVVFGLTLTQAASLSLAVFSAGMLVFLYRRQGRNVVSS